MTQYDEPTFPDQFDQPPTEQRTSGLAIASLVCGLFICCPLVTALGPILGVVALVVIGNNPTRKGRGLAIAGILIGLLVTAIWVFSLVYAYRTLEVPVREGPREAMTAGERGEYDNFRAHFFGDAAAASDEEIRAFFEELNRRYGAYQTMERDEAALQADPPGLEEMMEPIRTMPYRIVFENETVDAEIEHTAVDPQTGQLTGIRFGRIIILDEERGDLEFPPPSD